MHSGCCNTESKIGWYRNKVFLAASILLILSGFSYLFHPLIPFRHTLLIYFRKIWWAALLGFVIGGIIDYFIPREYISHVLAREKKRTILYAVILGFFMSTCSHGILALSMELHKKGASNPAVVAFLLASPWASLPLTIMLIGFFGLKALYIITSAIIVATLTGFIYQFLQSRGLIETNRNTTEVKEDFSIIEDIGLRIKSYKFSIEQVLRDIRGIITGAFSLADMVLWWLLIGIGVASLVAAYVPQNIFHHYMGPTSLGMIITLIAATILEVCSEGTSPLAFEIYRQTGAFGNSFVFLMAGVVTDYTEIGLLWTNVGRRVALWLPVITVPQVLIFGIIANILF
jgi:uncharacterized membrane protein YraQ (UPF0718 family)